MALAVEINVLSGAAVEPGSELPDSMALRRVHSAQRNAAFGVSPCKKRLLFHAGRFQRPAFSFVDSKGLQAMKVIL